MLGMSNVFGGGVVTPMSLELAQWYCWEGLFRLVAFSRAHHLTGLLRGLDLSHYLPWTVTNSSGISKSRSSASMVHLGGCDLVLLAGMVLTLVTGSPANRIASSA